MPENFSRDVFFGFTTNHLKAEKSVILEAKVIKQTKLFWGIMKLSRIKPLSPNKIKRGKIMKRICFTLIAALVLVGFANAQNRQGNSQLREVKKIFVGELGRTDEAEIVREKIKLRLARTGKYSIVDRKEDADAILTGTVVMSRQIEGNFKDIDTESKAVAVFYLRSAESDEILWTYEFSPKLFDLEIITDKATHGYNQVAKRTVGKLIKDAGFRKM